ncbi:MAG: DEAD/DEAH box helicase, partial [Bacteroidota bacterium]
LDVFPFVGEHPVRVEFWGDTIESIREFDLLSQRSIRELESATIVANLALPSDGTPNETPSRKPSTLFDYLRNDALVVLDNPLLIRKTIEEIHAGGARECIDWDSLQAQSRVFPRVIHSGISDAISSDVHDVAARPQPPTNGSIKILLGHMRQFQSEGYRLILACDTAEETVRIRELLDEEMTAPQVHQNPEPEFSAVPAMGKNGNGGSDTPVAYVLLSEAVHAGFVFPAARIALFTEHQIFGRLKRRGRGRRKAFRGLTQKEFLQLRRGDYVVHVDHGIGQFVGLQTIKVRGVDQEVMKVLYDDNDTLYVNLNYVNRVQKYASQEGHLPKLNKIGSPDWERLTARAKRKIKDIARHLITLYARRKHEPGFAFPPDTHWQKEMEASFMYEDTADQARSTMEIKKDMETPNPMDRLVCGDVGFGKTEVAVRAAFKAVMGGKQAAVLVPTTILAHQHFRTFLDRLGRYTVRVESLTRFKSKKEQTAILEALKSGQVDILIGTHRLLSKDVHFKDLGLLVIDEEHRFGVTAKEKLRQLRATV